MVKDKISVIMSCYNSEKTVKLAVESILLQSFKNFEFLIFDDGSTDNTLKILKEFNDKRIRIFSSKENLGLTRRLNFLANKSTGNYIARQDDDDFSLSERLEIQINFLKDNLDYAACSSSSYLKNSFKVHPNLSKYIYKKVIILLKNPYIHGTLLIRTSDFNELGGYNEYFKYSQDYKLYLDLFKKNKKIKFFRSPLYVLNLNGRISSNKKNLQNNFKKEALKMYLKSNS